MLEVRNFELFFYWTSARECIKYHVVFTIQQLGKNAWIQIHIVAIQFYNNNKESVRFSGPRRKKFNFHHENCASRWMGIQTSSISLIKLLKLFHVSLLILKNTFLQVVPSKQFIKMERDGRGVWFSWIFSFTLSFLLHFVTIIRYMFFVFR